MAAQSAYNKIQKKIKSFNKGRVFFPNEFAAVASSDAARSALVRLCRVGLIMRVAQGVYCVPKEDTKWNSGLIMPSIEEVAEKIAQRDRVRIAPTGAYALNKLGLSTQVPANVVFVTDGSGRRVSLGGGKGILFKHTSEMRTFAYRSCLMRLIVTAMREIGERELDDSMLAVLIPHLANVSKGDFEHDIQLAPIWVRNKLKKV